MRNIKIKKIVLFSCVLLFQPLVSPGSFAFARKKSPPKAYSFIAEGGKASQGECDGERKIPRRLKRLKEFSKFNSYMGSELQSPEVNVKADQEMWKHLFRSKDSCNTVLAKTPSSLDDALKDTKKELPPDDSEESDSDTDKDNDNEQDAEKDKDTPKADGPDSE